MIVLSERLMEIANMVTPGLKVADIGCDHAYLSIYLAGNDISPWVCACDVNKGPMEIALNNIKHAGLEDKICVRLGDGLAKISPGEVESVVIAGMGGSLIINILSDGKAVAQKASEIILGPQSDVEKVRHYLEDSGYRIVSESFVSEDDKFYPVIKAIHGTMNLDNSIYYKYGKILIHEANPVLREYLILQKKQLSHLIEQLTKQKPNDGIAQRISELKIELMDCEKAICEMEGIDFIHLERIIE